MKKLSPVPARWTWALDNAFAAGFDAAPRVALGYRGKTG